jgi:heptaprenyl diphosphate synthase
MSKESEAGKLTALSILTATALVLFTAEAYIPPLTPFPGIKLGLANIITLFILHRKDFSAIDALLVVIARVLLAGLVTGSLLTLAFSFSGGVAALFTMLLFRKVMCGKLIPIVSVAGAIVHNLTQISVAAIISGTAILLYLPVLILGAILSGLLTGFTVSFILRIKIRR